MGSFEKPNRDDNPTSACLRHGDSQGSSVVDRIFEDVIVEMILSALDDHWSQKHGERGPHKCAGVPMGIGGWMELGRCSNCSQQDQSSIDPV